MRRRLWRSSIAASIPRIGSGESKWSDHAARQAKKWIASARLFPKGFAVRIVKTIAAMQRLARHWRRTGTPVAFVPTMGSLHRGHLSLIQKARKCAGRKGRVVVSIYVNPAQFGPGEDLAKYPRDLKGDKKLCAEAGADVLFVPSTSGMYPPSFSTWVTEKTLARGMEGVSRPAHFRGVATVVTKLFQIVLPDIAVFGAKDFQQSAIIRRMTRDLNFPLKIIVASTVREADGLAMSSRNKYLSPAQRRQATVLWRAIQKARSRAAKGRVSAVEMKQELRRLIAAEPEARVDYIAFYDPNTLEPAREIKKGTQIALAVFIGKTRLIDNAKL
jgi:pantoate--beta-alanine ligase